MTLQEDLLILAAVHAVKFMILLARAGFLYGLAVVAAHAQVIPATDASEQSISQNDLLVLTYVEQQASLTQERMALVSQGASPATLQAWYQQNAGVIAYQQQQAALMAANAATEPSAVTQPISTPANASATMTTFLTAQVTLANARAQIHNQLLQALPASATESQIAQMLKTQEQTFQQQNAGNEQLQVGRSSVLANEGAQTPIPLPKPLQLSPNEKPRMAAYQTLLYQFRLSRAQTWNKYVNATPAVRAAAMQAWRQKVAAQIQQLRQAQILAQSAPST